MRTLQWYTLALGAIAAALGCGSDTVSPPSDAAALSIEPKVATVGIGSSLKLTASFPREASAGKSSAEVVWRSANDAIASITPTGMVQGVQVGQTRVVATWHDMEGAALVTVVDGTRGKRLACSAERLHPRPAAVPVGKGICR